MWSSQYLAGVLDSDGSFSVTKRHVYRNNCNYTTMIQLTWTKNNKTEQFMKELVDYYGGSYYESTSNKNRYKNSAPVIKYCATGKAAKRICLDVRRFLVLKKSQATNLLTVQLLVNSFKGNRPKNITNKLEKLYTSNRKLNTKNGVK